MKNRSIRKWLLSSGVLTRVTKPSRYIGQELNTTRKVKRSEVSFLLAFPDIYEVGMSHTGLKIIYSALNSLDWVRAERTYLPWKDMIDEMKKHGVPLYSLESFEPALSFDVLGITLQYELSYTNVLGLLELARIPLFQSERITEPLVVGGGPCVSNPEPVAPFFDAFVVGDGEQVVQEIAELLRERRSFSDRDDRQQLLKNLSTLKGVYVPSLGRDRTTKAVIKSLENPLTKPAPIVPFANVVHNRGVVEIMRGCTRGCRFCQAGMIYRPVRERSVEDSSTVAFNLEKATGFEELSLMSLSSTDHSSVTNLIEALLPVLKERNVAISLPSSRIDAFGIDIAARISSIRKTGLTFAPEAGSARLRRVINKNVSEEHLIRTIESARKQGWRRVKLYFMIGLPTETDVDLREIVRLSRLVRDKGIKQLSVSVAIFVPKPHTPFQYLRQLSIDEAEERSRKLFDIRRFGFLQIHDPRKSLLEGVISRGDSTLADILLSAYQQGALFDEWHEEFDYPRWERAFATSEKRPEEYLRARSVAEELPWDHIDMGIRRSFLVKEYFKALREEPTLDCRSSSCLGCGIENLSDAGSLEVTSNG